MFIAFIASVLFIIYVYLGYPMLLWIFTRDIDKEYPDVAYQGDISVVMVVCNEAKNICKKIDNLKELSYRGGDLRFIIVDDCSDDNTLELIAASGFDCTLLKSLERKGKASGINLAMKNVTTELVTLIDCRQELELQAIEHLSSWFEARSKFGAVSGELKFRTKNGNDFSEAMDGYWRYEKFIRKSEALLSSVPGVSGALYMLRTDAFEEIPETTLLDDVLIPMIACKKGYKVGFDDRAVAWDVPSSSSENEKRRKIRTLSGNYQLLFRNPMWVLPTGHPIWWQFFSHKIARLMVPLVFILSVILSIILSIGGVVYAQFYIVLGLSVLLMLCVNNKYLGNIGSKLKKLIISFCILNWFCLLALFQFFKLNKSGAWSK